MEIYWTIQLTIFGSCLLEFFCKKNTKFYILATLCIIVALFGGLRWNTGNDWNQYLEYFKQSSWSNIFSLERTGILSSDKLEPGFVFLNIAIKSLFNSFYWYNIVICGFLQFSYYKFIKYHSPKYPLMMYAVTQLTMWIWFPIRAGLAVGVLLWAYKYIKERNLFCFLIIVLIASSIHLQSLIILPFYWIGNFRLKTSLYLAIYLLFFFLGKIFQDYFEILAFSINYDRLNHYLENETEGNSLFSYLHIVMQFSLFTLYLYLSEKKVFGDEKWSNTLINAFLIQQCIAFVFQDGMGDLSRIKDPLNIVIPFMFCNSMYYLIKSKNAEIKLGALFLYILYVSRGIMALGNDYFFKITCIPYRTIFDYHFTLF